MLMLESSSSTRSGHSLERLWGLECKRSSAVQCSQSRGGVPGGAHVQDAPHRFEQKRWWLDCGKKSFFFLCCFPLDFKELLQLALRIPPPPLPLIFPLSVFLGAKGYFVNVLVGACRNSCPPVLFGWQSLEKNRTTTTTTRKKRHRVVRHESASGARQTTDEFYVSLVVNVLTVIHLICVFTSDMQLIMSLIEIWHW